MSYIGNEPIVSATRTVTEVTATAGQTVFNANGGYTVGYLDVFLNGAQLQTVDFTATNGSSVTLTEAAQVNDVVRLVAWGTFSTSNLVSPNYTGTLTGGTGVVNIGSGQIYKSEAGNVGIGTSSPLAKLDVTGDGIALNGSSRYRSLELYESGTRRAYFTYDSTTNVGGLVTEEFGSSLQFGTSNQERMRIDSAGLLCINRTTATNGSYINISQAGNVGWGITVQNTTSTTSNLPVLVSLNSAGTVVGYIDSNNTSTAYITSSDYRLKENVAPMAGALDKVAQLKPCTYTWKADGSTGQGFIAHELQEVVPDCVVGEKDAVNEDGSIKPQGIDTSFLVATLTAAIQEQQVIITDLKSRIEALEGINND